MKTLMEYLKNYAHSQAQAPIFKLAHGAELTYGLLYSSMQAFAAFLREQGITRQKRVAVILPSGPEFAAAVLSISACAVCVPLNPASTSSELEGLLSWLRVDAVVLPANSIHEATCRKCGLPVLPMHFSLSGESGDFAPERASVAAQFDDWAQPDDIAIVFHTSGTTAKPKIVPITHRNLCSPLPQYIRYFNLSERDSIISATPLFHAFGIHIMLTTTIASGGSVIFLPDYSVETMLAGVRDYRATRFGAVPVVLDSLADHVRRRELPPEPTGLRYIHTGGAAIKPETLLCVEAYFAAPVIVGYGLSELGVTLTASPLPPQDRAVESVGHVIHSEVAIVDETMAGLPPLTCGEVVVRGPAVFAGYENDPQANAASFAEGWFRTGDQGYFDHAGLLFITGRFKEIINKGGQKIAPMEVDEALQRLAGVRDAVCFPIPHGRLGEDVAAAIVLQGGAQLNDTDIRRMLRAELSEFKIPGKIVFIDAIPQNANGKILRNSLYATLVAQTPELFCKGVYAAPQTAMEAELVEMWQPLLGLEAVCVREGFFSLGGDSLQAAVLLAQVQARWQVDLPVSVLLEAGTICELAARISDRLSPLDPLVAIQPRGTAPPLFFIHAVTAISCSIFT